MHPGNHFYFLKIYEALAEGLCRFYTINIPKNRLSSGSPVEKENTHFQCKEFHYHVAYYLERPLGQRRGKQSKQLDEEEAVVSINSFPSAGDGYCLFARAPYWPITVFLMVCFHTTGV